MDLRWRTSQTEVNGRRKGRGWNRIDVDKNQAGVETRKLRSEVAGDKESRRSTCKVT